jgi:hypothetical protein
MISKLPDYLWLDAKDVVADTIRTMSTSKPKAIVIPGTQYKVIVFINRYLPWLAAILTRRTAKHFRVTD